MRKSYVSPGVYTSLMPPSMVLWGYKNDKLVDPNIPQSELVVLFDGISLIYFIEKDEFQSKNIKQYDLPTIKTKIIKAIQNKTIIIGPMAQKDLSRILDEIMSKHYH